VQIKVVCEEPIAMEDVRLVRWPYTADGEVEDIRSFDVAVAPLIEAAWTRGKVSTKILAYFAAGLPVVASDVNANRIYVRDNENGFLVGTLGDWEDRLNRLVEDPALRSQLGARARESAEQEFSIESAVPKYLALFERLAPEPQGR
jgi:glycosyltransferase involved in cell wall biosynthesis